MITLIYKHGGLNSKKPFEIGKSIAFCNGRKKIFLPKDRIMVRQGEEQDEVDIPEWLNERMKFDELFFKNKLNNNNMIKTAKIKNVVSTKPYTNSFGTTIYHMIEMDNGDKINIGKKELQQVGATLTYEIIDSGQEYNKAKSAKLEQQPASSFNGKIDYNTNDDKRQRLIVRQSSLKEAVAILAHNKDNFTLKDVKDLTEKLVDFIFEENHGGRKELLPGDVLE